MAVSQRERRRGAGLSIGPFLAAVQTYAALAAVVTLGPLAKLILENWIPFTRQLWSNIIEQYSPWPLILSDAEKDSLTAVALFAPLAVSSAYSALRSAGAALGEADEDPEEVGLRSAILRSSLLRSAAFLISIVVLFLISRQIINDAISLVASVDYTDDARLSISVITAGIVLLFALFVFTIYFLRSDISFWKKLIAWGTTGAGLVEFLILAGPALIGAYFAAQQLGPIRTLSVIVVILSILLTLVVKPSRIIAIFVILMGLILLGVVWDTITDMVPPA
jgi:hypothetical protein